MRSLSLHHLTMLSAHPLALVDAAAAGGFDYCGLRLVAPSATDTLVDVVGQPALARQIDQRLRATGVKLLDIEAIWLHPDTDVRQLVPALEVGKQLGARHALVVGNDADETRLLDNFCQLCEAAQALDMRVGLEFITYCTIGNQAQALSLLRRSQQANAGLLIDALQFFRSGGSCDEVAALPPGLMPYMQICDGLQAAPLTLEDRRREARTDRRLPGEGELPLADLIQAAPPHIVLSVEAPTLKLASLPFDEQARQVGDATRRFLQQLPGGM